MADAPRKEPWKVLAATLFGLGAIPTAVFGAIYLLARATLGFATPFAQAVVVTVAIAGALVSLYVLTSLGARAIVGEIEAIPRR